MAKGKRKEQLPKERKRKAGGKEAERQPTKKQKLMQPVIEGGGDEAEAEVAAIPRYEYSGPVRNLMLECNWGKHEEEEGEEEKEKRAKFKENNLINVLKHRSKAIKVLHVIVANLKNRIKEMKKGNVKVEAATEKEKAEFNRVVEELEEMKEERAKFETIEGELRDRVSKLEQHNAKLESEKKTSKAEFNRVVDDMKGKLAKYKTIEEEQKEQISGLEQRNQKLKTENKKSNEDLIQADAELHQTRKQEKKYAKELGEAKATVWEQNRLIKQLEKQKKAIEERLNQVEEELRQSEEQKVAALGRCGKLLDLEFKIDELEYAAGEWNAKKEKAKEDYNALLERNKSMEIDLGMFKNLTTILEAEKEDIKAELDRVEKELREVKSSIADRDWKIKELNDEVARCEADLKKSLSENAAWQAKEEDLRLAMKELKEKMDKEREKAWQTQEDLNEKIFNEGRKKLEGEVANRLIMEAQLKNRISELDQINLNLRAEKDESKAEFDRIVEELSEVKSSIADRDEKMKAMDAEMGKHATVEADLKSCILDRDREIHKMNGELTKCKRVVANLKCTISEIGAEEKQKANDYVHKWIGEYEARFESKVVEWTKRKEGLQAEIKQLKEKLGNVEEKKLVQSHCKPTLMKRLAEMREKKARKETTKDAEKKEGASSSYAVAQKTPVAKPKFLELIESEELKAIGRGVK